MENFQEGAASNLSERDNVDGMAFPSEQHVQSCDRNNCLGASDGLDLGTVGPLIEGGRKGGCIPAVVGLMLQDKGSCPVGTGA